MPVRSQTPRGGQVSQTMTTPAPVGGWNARDPIAKMPPTDAVILENWYCLPERVSVRQGAADFATGFPGDVLHLVQYQAAASSKLFAATNTTLHDITSGSVGASVRTLTNGYLYYRNFATAAGQFLLCVNGADPYFVYNGATWSAPSLTGAISSDKLAFVEIFKQRAFFAAKDSLSLWYLPAGSIGGALTEFPLAQFLRKGGHLVSLGTWTIDAGDGADDKLAAITSEGEVAVFSGTDPNDPASWRLEGVYYVAPPLGRNCFTKFGGDLVALTQTGIFPLSKALQSVVINRASSLSDKIQRAYSDYARDFESVQGWQFVIFPQENLVLVNVPASPQVQLVMSTLTGAWSLFSGLTARNWIYYNGDMYYSTGAKVARFWVGNGDFGAAIQTRAQQAFFQPVRGKQTHVKLLRPHFLANGSFDYRLALLNDFESNIPASTASIPSTSMSLWGSAIWGTSLWGATGERSYARWQTVRNRPSMYWSLLVQLPQRGVKVSWVATDFSFVQGGLL